MPILDAIRNREYKAKKQREYRAKWKAQAAEKANGDNGDNEVSTSMINESTIANNLSDLSQADRSRLAEADEKQKMGQEYVDMAARIRAEVIQRAQQTAKGVDGIDAYGSPIGTNDEQGRPLGQLDALNDELASLNSTLSKLNETQSQFTAELQRADELSKSASTIEERIEAKKRVSAIKELIKENGAELSTLKDTIRVKEERVAREDAIVKQLRDDIANCSEGGLLYTNKTAYAEYIEDTDHKQGRVDEALKWLASERGKHEANLKVYTLKD
jgi:hypothetical protein